MKWETEIEMTEVLDLYKVRLTSSMMEMMK